MRRNLVELWRFWQLYRSPALWDKTRLNNVALENHMIRGLYHGTMTELLKRNAFVKLLGDLTDDEEILQLVRKPPFRT